MSDRKKNRPEHIGNQILAAIEETPAPRSDAQDERDAEEHVKALGQDDSSGSDIALLSSPGRRSCKCRS